MSSRQLPDRARFGVRFSLLARRWRRLLDAELAAAGLTDATWVPLIHLQETGGGITQKELAERVGVEASSLVRVLDILSGQGLIERRMGEKDARTRFVYLTSAGSERVAEIRRQLWEVEQHLLIDLPDAAIAEMLQHFDKIEQRLAARETARERAGK